MSYEPPHLVTSPEVKMSRRDFLKAAGIGAAAITLPTFITRCGPDEPKPNIIFIMTDDMGYGDASCYNPASVIRTPNIDKMASQGIRFTDAHSPSAVCTPTRYSVLTGRYCWRSRLKRGVFGGYNTPLIEDGRVTVASMLKDQGYATACIGKWHLGWDWASKTGAQPEWDYEQEDIDFSKPIKNGPNAKGFDYFFGTSGCTTDDPPMCFIENDRTVGIPDHFAAEDPADEDRLLMTVDGWQHEDADYEFMNKTLWFMENQAKQKNSFFVYLPLSVPHIPWFPHEEFKGKSGAGPRGDQVLMADKILGEVMNKLDELGISENTLLIFTSDNGPRTGINGHESAAELRGYKGSIWEGGHRVPFIAKWPGKITAGAISGETMGLMDLMATCAAVTGTQIPESAGEDSFNMLPAILGKNMAPIRDFTIHHSGGGVFALRQGDWKLIEGSREGGYDDGPSEGEPGGLYNLADDPAETTNLWDDKPGKVQELMALLNKARDEGFTRKG